mmetsp:Transcript_25013/g.36932  ORF Transcript_25013/g.36932 Transcript_25013/m.36932 type:complete len:256 (-) Transcript_25013:140-907(-)
MDSDANKDMSAEDHKKLGNEAFASKNYEEAIGHYSNAISCDPENAIYYSNRSACHSSLKAWDAAIQDASTCISKNPSFVKGYYRLAVAHTELGNFDDAQKVLQEALRIDSENEQLQKQLRVVRAKKAALTKQKARAPRQLDESQRRELMELQEQTSNYARDLRGVQGSLASCQRDLRSNLVTKQQIDTYDAETPLYRTVGKAFLREPRDSIETFLQKESEKLSKTQRDLEGRKEYLERRIASNKSNIADIASSSA